MEKNLLVNAAAEPSGCSCCSGHAAADSAQPGATDPVCGMTVDPATAKASSMHEGQTYYFCAPGCRRAFDNDPNSFLTPAN